MESQLVGGSRGYFGGGAQRGRVAVKSPFGVTGNTGFENVGVKGESLAVKGDREGGRREALLTQRSLNHAQGVGSNPPRQMLSLVHQMLEIHFQKLWFNGCFCMLCGRSAPSVPR